MSDLTVTGLVGGADVFVTFGDQGERRLVDIERRLSSPPDLLNELAAAEGAAEHVLVRFTIDFDDRSFVRATNCDRRFRLIESSDGQVSDVLHRPDHSDRSARTDAFDFHNDGLYLNEPPDYCALYCLDHGDGDIPTTFVESCRILKRLEASGVSLQTLSSLRQAYVDRRGMRHAYDIVRPHPRLGHPTLQYFDGDGDLHTSPLKLFPLMGSEDLREIRGLIHGCIRECQSQWESLHWKRGHFVVWDNYAFLHARPSTKIDLRRHLKRFWIRRIDI
jgi:alpha-ketoglutarate-dependent taurine dioxygenase